MLGSFSTGKLMPHLGTCTLNLGGWLLMNLKWREAVFGCMLHQRDRAFASFKLPSGQNEMARCTMQEHEACKFFALHLPLDKVLYAIHLLKALDPRGGEPTQCDPRPKEEGTRALTWREHCRTQSFSLRLSARLQFS